VSQLLRSGKLREKSNPRQKKGQSKKENAYNPALIHFKGMF